VKAWWLTDRSLGVTFQSYSHKWVISFERYSFAEADRPDHPLQFLEIVPTLQKKLGDGVAAIETVVIPSIDPGSGVHHYSFFGSFKRG
jgi:hypothetical protein